MRCLSALPILCLALAASQPARAVVVTSEATMVVSEKLSVSAAQSIVLGNTNLTNIQPPVIVTPGTLSRVTAQPIAIASSAGTAVTQRLTGAVGRGAVQQASFVIVGDSDRSVSIAVPETVALSRLGGDGEELQFDSQTSLGEGGQSRLGGSAGGSGELAFDVGGKVRLGDYTVAGEYAGVLRVTVQYN